MPFLDDEEIAQAKSQKCILCLAEPGEECVDLKTRRPLIETTRRRIHIARRSL